MQREAVLVRVNRHRPKPQLGGGAHNPNSNLTPIGDEQLLHGWFACVRINGDGAGNFRGAACILGSGGERSSRRGKHEIRSTNSRTNLKHEGSKLSNARGRRRFEALGFSDLEVASCFELRFLCFRMHAARGGMANARGLPVSGDYRARR
jgi:hypothetical protein